MTDEDISNLTTIDALIEKKQPFAVFRLPGEKHPCLLRQTSEAVRVIRDLKELNGQKGFVIAPFRINEESPVVVIQPDCIEREFSIEEDLEKAGKTLTSTLVEEAASVACTSDYANCFGKFINALHDKEFDKLVLSRNLSLNKTAGFSPAVTFAAACQRYIHSYVYLCYTPQTGVWLGSTPEIILSGGDNEWNTVALAGTQPLQDGKLPQIWDDKNRKEQDYVSAYIRHQLLSLGIHPVENGPYPAYAGALSHLKTDFRFSLNNNEGLGDILQLLHPTPAVCGLPKEKAYQFILENEGYDRKYYSGFVGWLDPEGRTDLYVNLRCMYIGDTLLTLYAGGGILSSSELNDEWQETEKKLQTMKRIISQPLITNH